MAKRKSILAPAIAIFVFAFAFLGILVPVTKYMFAMYWATFLKIFPYALVSLSILTIIGLIYVLYLENKSEKKNYKVFEDKDVVSVRRAKELLLEVFPRFGVPTIKIEEGFWRWKTTKIFCDAVEFITHTYSQFRNQPTCLFEVAFKKGIYAGEIRMVHVPLSRGEREITEENFQIIDENRYGFKLKRDFPLLPIMSEAQRLLEELGSATGGDLDKIEELKEIVEVTKSLPNSSVPSEAVPPEFHTWNMRGKYKYPQTRYRQPYPVYVPPSDEEEGSGE